jgi:hypothetical protein
MFVRSFIYGALSIAMVLVTWSATAIASAPKDKEIRVDQVEPSGFGPGFEISITGRGFRSQDRVKIGRFELENPTITPTEIRGKVPKQVKKASRMIVLRGGKPIATFRDFTFTPIPRVLSVYPAFGKPGRKVTINGEALGTVTSVKIGTRSMVPDHVSENRITFTVPEGARTGMIAIVSPIATITSQDEFEVFYPPTLTGADKNSGSPGDVVILMGSNLGSNKVHFKLGKVLLKVVSRYHTSATVILPKGARSGRFSVTSRGHTHTLETDFAVSPKKATSR